VVYNDLFVNIICICFRKKKTLCDSSEDLQPRYMSQIPKIQVEETMMKDMWIQEVQF